MAAKTNALTVTLPSDLEIKLTREFDAPRTLVFKAMSSPELIRQWWGPRGSELTKCEMDFRPGGTWNFVSRSAEGVEHPFKGEYLEIVAPERVVQTFIYDVPPINEYVARETMTLEERSGRTLLTTIVLHETKQARDGQVESGMERGAGETMDRLAELLQKMA